MLITQEKPDVGRYHIRAYTQDSITINDQIYTNSLIIAPEKLITPWAPPSLEALQPEHFSEALALSPEILLLGTGPSFKIPSLTQLIPAYENKISIEYMDTHAACRTYIALLSEGRVVVAMLLMQ